MKNTCFLFLLLFCLAACSDKEENSDILGTWKLIEQYSDPGDGSGSFMPVEGDKTITFFADNKITSNGNICDLSIGSTTEGSEGTYSLTDSTITPTSCELSVGTLSFTLNPPKISIFFPCIEGCGQKFQKMD